MPRKEALITQAVAHLGIDLACFFLLARNLGQTQQTKILVGTGYLIFLILSFGLRPFLGLIMDEFPRIHAQTTGCILAAVSCLFPQSWAWVSLFPAAIGSAFFHTGAMGEGLAFARGHFSRNAIILSTGALGAALGTILGQKTQGTGGWMALQLFLSSIACFFFAEAPKYPRRIRSFRNTVSRVFPGWGGLALTLIPAGISALVAALLPADWAKGWLALLPAASCMLGRLLGGIAADRFGPRKTSAVSFSVSLLFLTVFTHVPGLYCLGLCALSAPLSVTLGTASTALPTKPHFMGGVCSVVLLIGAVPSFFRGAVTDSVRILCAGLLILSLAISIILYTDHCRTFGLNHKNRGYKTKGGRI